MPRIDLNPHDWDEVSRILRIHVPGYEIWAFGSRVTWSAKQYSDLDLAVITKQPLPLSTSADLKNAFAESSLSIKVDVVDWATTAESFRRIIEKDKVIVQVPQPSLLNWTFKRLIDCTRDGNLSYGIVQPGQHDEEGIPIVRVNNVNSGQLRLDDVMRVSPEIEAKYKRTRLEGGEVLLTLVGSTGQSVVVPNKLAGWNIARAIAVIRPRPEIGANWINICLQSKAVQQFLDERANTTVQKTLNLGDVKELPIPIPPREVKDAIESVAMALSNKFELNRRMNETLEAIARAMFKSWFVDFDPVRAKMSGETPESICQRLGLTPDLLALFPDRLVDSELGEIPEGWGVGAIGEQVDVVGGGTPSTKESEYWEGGTIHWTTPKDLSGLHDKVLLKTERKITEKGLQAISSDLLPIDTVLMSSRAPVGYLALAKVPTAINQGFIAMKCNKRLPPEYVIQWAESVMDEIKQRASGTTFAEISKKTFRSIQVVLPPLELINEYAQITKAIYGKITLGASESFSLGELRDALLPKLLSGELLVTELDSE
ncbi:MAG: restriction endonuclease subunit S [Gallionella sp.]|jgi:type I restriction enzyme S subunit|nr:restriction endonuclease subunit S [Gallionella sp.]MCK9354041.1 restriction endonuclease subunit S [Gallionella sp.]